MKKNLLLVPITALFIYFILSGNAAGPGVSSGVNGTGATGITGCGASCHGASPTVGITVALELDSAGFPVTHYIGGNSYTIKITGTNTTASIQSKFGFQVTAVLLAGAGTGSAVNAGTLATTGLPAGCQNTTLVPSFHIIEHSSALSPATGTGGAGTTYVESIPWTAPVSGTGSIKLYGVVNAVNNNGSDLGDFWNNTSVTITELVTIAPITGTTTACVGSTVPLSDVTAGGTWSSSNTARATVTSGGIVSGVSAGTATITYATGSGTAVTTFTVVTFPTAGTIAGIDSVCPAHTITLSDAVAGGVWSTQNTNASVSGSGVVTGIAAGFDSVFYTVTNACGSVKAGLRVKIRSASACAAGTATIHNEEGVRIYPNPSYGSFTLDLPKAGSAATITITDIFGKTIETKVINEPGKSSAVFKLSKIAPGNYFIRIDMGDKIYREKILIR